MPPRPARRVLLLIFRLRLGRSGKGRRRRRKTSRHRPRLRPIPAPTCSSVARHAGQCLDAVPPSYPRQYLAWLQSHQPTHTDAAAIAAYLDARPLPTAAASCAPTSTERRLPEDLTVLSNTELRDALKGAEGDDRTRIFTEQSRRQNNARSLRRGGVAQRGDAHRWQWQRG